MILPNLSYMVSVGQTRFIQSRYETPEYRNPDGAVGDFLSAQQRFGGALRGKLFRSRLRANPFYHYVLARTRYYDQVFLDAIYAPVERIVNIGCGSDTRAYRYAYLLSQKGVRVVECDQAQAILAKQRIARSRWPTAHVDYRPLDLNDANLDGFFQMLASGGATLVMLEGVSPYIDAAAYSTFLRRLADTLAPGSQLAYDFKIEGVAAGFGETSVVKKPFRLPLDRDHVTEFHRKLGHRVDTMESSAALVGRTLPSGCPTFSEDCLLRLTPNRALR